MELDIETLRVFLEQSTVTSSDTDSQNIGVLGDAIQASRGAVRSVCSNALEALSNTGLVWGQRLQELPSQTQQQVFTLRRSS